MDKEMQAKISELIKITEDGEQTWRQESESSYFITKGSGYEDKIQISVQRVYSIGALAARLLEVTPGKGTSAELFIFNITNIQTKEVIFSDKSAPDSESGKVLQNLYLAAAKSAKKAAMDAIDKFL